MEKSRYIDHTFLKPNGTSKDIDKLIEEAIKYDFKTICINPCWIKYAKEKLKNNKRVGITTVIGFPLGSMTSCSKSFEAKNAIEIGANEIDMVMNIGFLKTKKYDWVLKDIQKVKKALPKNILKVIIETALLTKEEIKKATEIVLESGADYIKTSTGFSTRGASFEDIEIMNSIIKNKIGIKAAGGVKTPKDFDKMIGLGATRIGTSSGVNLILNKNNNKDY